MDEPFVDILTKSSLYKKLSDTCKVPLNKCHPCYPHLTFKITSLSQYVEVINVIKMASITSEGDMIFRGMADYRWALLPSLARHTLVIGQVEHKMVRELLLMYPGEFANISSNFDLLAKMQHYGLPTRLLDFTTNPLVALFFACHEEKNDSMGRVISTIPVYQPFIDNYIEAICGLCKVNNYDNYYLEKLIENVISFAEFGCGMRYPLIAKPQYSNDRIKNQSAMFMVFQNEIRDRGGMTAYASLKAYEATHSAYISDEYRDILETEDLEYIYPDICKDYKDEDNWLVTSETLSRIGACRESDVDTERKSRYVNGMFAKDFTVFPHRFAIVPQIKRIDSEIMHNDFCSILIDPKYKKKILDELDTININERFLFPELEYTVKHVKNKYWTPYK